MPWNKAHRHNATQKAKAFAPKLRRETTDAEKRFWWHLRERMPPKNTHFRRQIALGPYVVDSLCLEHKFVIELDGDQHGADEAIEYDRRRDAYLRSQGFRLRRFSNREIMTELEAVLDTIYAELHPSISHVAAASHEFTGGPHHG